MTDQTPVTDDDRKAHEWCAQEVDGTPEGVLPHLHAVARAIRAHVPAPPATLADEIRDRFLPTDDSPDNEERATVLALADCVEAVEHALDYHKKWSEVNGKAIAEVTKIVSEAHVGRPGQLTTDCVKQLLQERDEARAEVERLTRDRTSKESLPVALPDPADVPEGEAWLVKDSERNAVGVRVGAFPTPPWSVVDLDSGGVSRLSDSSVTLVSRLVPDTRRVIDRAEDLDKLPVGSIVLDNDGDPCKKISEGNFECGSAIFSAEGLLRLSAEVTVIHEGVTA
ncbi:hypothetical protein BJF89_13820 [Corynebacterium sp. CNJ-954]|uniref:hypothetical protein n=1 Tax=Corynebacterium sp. CNJ-954 TaxID=1904962 RepID=UPI00095BFD48|nr:hypothetical protein [Corynebacterium sp. CNJ-954]OLT55860.1 hypothetical protein BJF89_13820 [Corynebacterium sp. CNJ-954]